ncbi:unnamed protein product [Leuciscus chuanchicus]
MALWKEREKRTESGLEISTLVNINQLARNHYYLSSIVDMVEFLVVNNLPLRGSTDAFDSLTEGGSGLFLSLFEYTLRKDPEIRSVVQTIPRNATYTSHDIQNDVIANMSSLVTEEIVREVADSWYRIKVDGTRDPTGVENISIIVRFVKDNYQVTERLLSMTTAEKGDAQTLTNTINDNRRYETEVRMEAVGLIKEVSETSFKFIAHMVYKILQLLDAPNKLMQSEDMDLLSAVKLVTCASECLAKLRCESDFLELWEKADDNEMPKPSKRKRTINKGLQEYLLEESIGQAHGDLGNEEELRRLYYSTLDAVLAEISERFGERNSKLVEALSVFDPQNDSTFLEAQLVQRMLNLTNSEVVHSECAVARQFLRKELSGSISSGEKMTVKQILQRHHATLEAMPTVLAAMTFGASTAMCENSFSTLKNVFTDNRRSMLHQRKAHLVQLAFERDLTRKFRHEWKDSILRRFNDSKHRRLQLF